MALFANQFRLLTVLFVTCSVYLLLHSNFGGFRGFSSYVQVEEFPKKIWQSWKVDALRFEDRDTERAMSWTTKNPAHRYEVLTDDSAMTYVEHFYGPAGFNRPDIVYTYRSLNSIRIIQSDLLRYLIMYAEGGVWADIDVEAVRSIAHFLPKRFNEKDINMVIGIETDEPDFKGTLTCFARGMHRTRSSQSTSLSIQLTFLPQIIQSSAPKPSPSANGPSCANLASQS